MWRGAGVGEHPAAAIPTLSAVMETAENNPEAASTGATLIVVAPARI